MPISLAMRLSLKEDAQIRVDEAVALFQSL
jgi:hypothetical protein